VSNAEVASSKSKTFGFLTKARAIDIPILFFKNKLLI
jgi:hypothetical protein